MKHTPASPQAEAKTEALSDNPFAQLPNWFTEREVIPLEDSLALVVCHQTMRQIVALCRHLAENPAPVLLTGETGVGKSLLCRFIHASGDPYAPYVSLLTAGLEAKVLLARLFGPGECPDECPDDAAPGEAAPLMREAAGGTLVLEEMGDLPRAVQKRLMDFWDGGPRNGGPHVGGPARLLCATNTPPERLSAPGGLLPEFLARFRRIHVPPLRERKDDIPALVAYFSRLGASRTESLKSLEALAARLADHAFPGNVRELESLMALESGGLPWRWRITGGEKACCVRPPVNHAPKASKTTAPRRRKT
ncbi:MAG: hypothetical protein AUJ49_07875 [Desulfovibrionaceae bacterium CG1_02_65_16]|nr:MAG: hypothetical protein AUJ49_07875 [Desulfovibrionaceae bacterium CG1_02_65_16]